MSKSWLRCSIVSITVGLFCSLSTSAQNTGNSHLASSSGNAMVDTQTTPRYSTDELCDIIEEINPDLAHQIRLATDPDHGFLKIFESFIPRTGASDSGTIGLPTWIEPDWSCALVLIHEFTHAVRAHESDPNNPDANDPANSGPCAKCSHAMMGVTDYENACFLQCDPPPPPAELTALCERLKGYRKRINEQLILCWYDGCPSCCGMNYIPNVNELTSPPPCCP